MFALRAAERKGDSDRKKQLLVARESGLNCKQFDCTAPKSDAPQKSGQASECDLKKP